ncbi:ficolin-3-like [Teleopsis dalmanni]|uniref:ficolin-3-like n=1 Tax=Teleopsis dalmanni TaxID=139649 RepID=UPI0018CCCCD1|nr:ficolin-3-like [Teleopsis dalmanni]
MSKPLGRIIKILYALIFGIYLLEIGTAYFLTTIKCIKTHCPKHPTNCYEATRNTGKSDVYTLDIEGKSFLAYCEADVNGDGWLVIQRRQDGTIDFNRNWANYQSGFGNIYGEFFFGLNQLHTLTNKTPHELMIVTRLFDSTVLHIKYDNFLIGSEIEGYSLKKLGLSSGNATTFLGWKEGWKFWTKDRYNNSPCNEHFSAVISGGWWTNCEIIWDFYVRKAKSMDLSQVFYNFGITNLNDIYNDKEYINVPDNFHFFDKMNIRFVQMMIRPTGF